MEEIKEATLEVVKEKFNEFVDGDYMLKEDFTELRKLLKIVVWLLCAVIFIYAMILVGVIFLSGITLLEIIVVSIIFALS